MTRDSFRKFQKEMCVSGAPNHVGIYGCSCCRKVSCLNHFKKFCRRRARVQLKRETRNEIANEV